MSKGVKKEIAESDSTVGNIDVWGMKDEEAVRINTTHQQQRLKEPGAVKLALSGRSRFVDDGMALRQKTRTSAPPAVPFFAANPGQARPVDHLVDHDAPMTTVRSDPSYLSDLETRHSNLH